MLSKNRLRSQLSFGCLLTSLLAGSGASLAQAGAKPSAGEPLYKNPSLPVERRVDDLVSRMTLDEKASQLLSVSSAIPRLGVPAYNWWSEGLHGVGNDGAATVFPQAIGFAATWNSPLVHQLATVISTEARARYQQAMRDDRHVQSEGLTFWSPNINIFRDPRWGRGQETYGEDPFLTARTGIAFVTGMQGDDPKYLKVVATPKHFAVHSGPEPARHSIDVEASKHDLADTYLPAFRATVTEAQAESVMCAYNAVNGEPDCANTFLLDDTLRKAWGFKGYVVSDCQAITDIYQNHKYDQTIADADAISMKRGTDLDCDFTQTEQAGYLDAVKRGKLTVADIDRSLHRLFTARFRLGMFDPPSMVPYASTPFSENDSEQHRQLALEVARQSMVLLKNDGTLPLKSPQKIAVIGPLADSLSALLGNYNGMPSRYETVLDGIRKQFPAAEITYIPGTSFLRQPFPVPRAAFLTADGKPGLNAEYFKNKDLSGPAALTRVDPQISFGFGVDQIPQWAEFDGYSARWTGTIEAPETGTYDVTLLGTGGARIWIDGKPILDHWKEDDWKESETQQPNHKFSVALEKGQKHTIKVEYLRFNAEKRMEFPRRLTSGVQLVWQRAGGDNQADAVASAAKADVVVAVVGITADLESEENADPNLPQGFTGGDRTSLDLPWPEEQLIEAAKATGKPLVVVLMNGSALSVNWADRNANAILEAWYPGEEGGTAVAETLAGANDPAGRLPVTFYRSVNDLPAFEDYRMENRTYRYYRRPVLYPFGYGLSYTTFAYSGLKLSKETIEAGEPLTVEVEVENTGKLPGSEVAELYESFNGRPGAPIRALRGFERVRLAPGEKKHIQFELSPRDLSYVQPDGTRVVGSGRFEIFVGGGQPGTKTAGTQTTFSIEGQQKLPD